MALDGDEIVAGARYNGRSGESSAEIAVTVEDEWQHLGVGQRLIKRLAKHAVDHGIESFELIVQPDNRAALGLLRKLSPEASVRFDRGEYAASTRRVRSECPALLGYELRPSITRRLSVTVRACALRLA